MAPVSPAFAPFAYVLSNWACASGNMALAHVIGHNMGCADQRSDPGSGAFAFSFGFYEPTNAFRTVITTQPFPEIPQIMLFSNPLVSSGGLPTGIADPSPDSADNALTLNTTRTHHRQLPRCVLRPDRGQRHRLQRELHRRRDGHLAGHQPRLRFQRRCPTSAISPPPPRTATTTAFPMPATSTAEAATTATTTTCRNECDFDLPVDEFFDAFIILHTDGWRMTNNSSPPGSATWGPGSNFIFNAHAGLANSSYILNDFNAAGPASAPSSATGSSARGAAGKWHRILVFHPHHGIDQFRRPPQVRMSTAGPSIDVGGTDASVGDLPPCFRYQFGPGVRRLSLNWQQFTATVTGLGAPTTGRFAFRYFVIDGGPAGSDSNLIGIDLVQVTPPVPDVNTNGVRDECDIGRGDSDLDGVVGIVDFLAVLANWGPCPAPCPFDADGDGEVGIVDFLLVLANWG